MSDTALQRRIPVSAEHVAAEVIDNEVVLFHPRRTTAVYLNATAALVWGLCDGARTVADIVALIEASYPDEQPIIAAGVGAALDDLHKDGMIVFR